jgi:hypothetical protein
MKTFLMLIAAAGLAFTARAQNAGSLTNVPSAVLLGMTTNLIARNIVIPYDNRYGMTFIARGADTNTQIQTGNNTTFTLDVALTADLPAVTNWTSTGPWSWTGIYTGGVAVATYSVIPPGHTNFANVRWLRLTSIAAPTNGTFFPSNIMFRASQ